MTVDRATGKGKRPAGPRGVYAARIAEAARVRAMRARISETAVARCLEPMDPQVERLSSACEPWAASESSADVKRLLGLAIRDLDGVDVMDPARCAIVRVVAALDRLLKRIDRLDVEVQGMAVAVVGHHATDLLASLASPRPRR